MNYRMPLRRRAWRNFSVRFHFLHSHSTEILIPSQFGTVRSRLGQTCGLGLFLDTSKISADNTLRPLTSTLQRLYHFHHFHDSPIRAQDLPKGVTHPCELRILVLVWRWRSYWPTSPLDL